MRIIAGRHRGRTILGPDSLATRPITNRAKQSLFDILAPHIEGAVVFDLFAGTGSMGLESLSRGAAAVTFFERDRAALKRLRKNLEALGEQKSATVIDRDIFRWFAPRLAGGASPPFSPAPKSNRGQGPPAKRADIIFLDPPYRYVRENAHELQSLARSLSANSLKDPGLLIFRHERCDTLPLPGLAMIDQRTYGSMAIDILQFARSPADENQT